MLQWATEGKRYQQQEELAKCKGKGFSVEQVENKKGQGSETGWFKELDVEGESGGVEGQEEGGGDAGGAGLHGRVQFTWWVGELR